MRLERACDFQDKHRCDHCNHTCAFGAIVREIRIRDRLICGLNDKELVRRILEQQFAQHLSLDRTLQICAAHESSKETESKLETNQQQSCVAAVAKSSFKKS